MWFRIFLISSCLVFGSTLMPAVTFGYEAVLETVPVPYDVIRLGGDGQTIPIILGELLDAPEMFELVVDATSTLTLGVRAVPASEPQPIFSVLIIKQKEIRGIEEVARLSATDVSWNRLVDGSTGLPYLNGPNFSETITPGTYRIEVSNPNNQGKYSLVLGSGDDDQSYIESLKAVLTTYEFYGTSKFKLFNSPYVYYPIGVLVLFIIMGVTVYKTRHRFINTSAINHA